MNDFIELRHVIAIVARRWWLILFVAAITASLSYAISRRQTPVYQANTTVLVGQFMQSTNLSKADIQTSEGFAQTYADLALREPVLKNVVTQLNLKETWRGLKNHVKVKTIAGTQLIEIDAEANSPQLAVNIADAVASQLIAISPTTSSKESQSTFDFTRQQLDSLQKRIINGQNRLQEIDVAIQGTSSLIEKAKLQSEKTTLDELVTNWERNYIEMSALIRQQSMPNNYLTVIEPAEADPDPVRPRVWLNTILSTFLGMVLGLGLIFLLETLEDTYQSLEDLYQSKELNILGVIERIKGKKLSDRIITQHDPSSSLVESYRMVRSRIHFLSGNRPPKSLVITSALPGEGKTVTASNLAMVFAQGGIRTILVDMDFQNPSVHHVFLMDNEKGLADLLNLQQPVEKVVDGYLRQTTTRNLAVITSGRPTIDSWERVGSERIGEIMNSLQKMADLIIFDSPPALLVADTMILSKKVDGVVLVIQAGKTKRSEIRHVLDDFQMVGANLYGCVFNQGRRKVTYAHYKSKKNQPGQLNRLEPTESNNSSNRSPLEEIITRELTK